MGDDSSKKDLNVPMPGGPRKTRSTAFIHHVYAPSVPDLWPDVLEGQGERVVPTWKPLHCPVYNLYGIGYLIASPKFGLPHLDRIMRWADEARKMGYISCINEPSYNILSAYLAHSVRMADHREWLRASLVSVHALPDSDDARPNQAVAYAVAQAHVGWMSSAAKSLGEVLLLPR